LKPPHQNITQEKLSKTRQLSYGKDDHGHALYMRAQKFLRVAEYEEMGGEEWVDCQAVLDK